ncbi:MAG: prolipoprotein diacylglyceryl transferase [Desulfosoma sp.]|uniref:prolipoprotein diacylglyceryl transferase n=1 Tax=Desulfosoma sp. TaxID=2603217 RepID=UPI00404A9757
MIPYPQIRPEIITIGPISVRWYGLMYVLGFLSTYYLAPRLPKARDIGLTSERMQDLILYLAVGLVLGARLGFLVFYQYDNWSFYLRNPLEIIATWHGGMSFHGGFIGSVVAGWIFCRRTELPFWGLADCVAVTAPIGLGLGRLGNFINGELYGRPSTVPWAMIFPDGGPFPRHPSQIYEALGEGVVLFAILWWMSRRPRENGVVVTAFLFFYGAIRFFLEFFREPDENLGFVWRQGTMGQVLCTAMMLVAVFLYWQRRIRRRPSADVRK